MQICKINDIDVGATINKRATSQGAPILRPPDGLKFEEIEKGPPASLSPIGWAEPAGRPMMHASNFTDLWLGQRAVGGRMWVVASGRYIARSMGRGNAHSCSIKRATATATATAGCTTDTAIRNMPQVASNRIKS